METLVKGVEQGTAYSDPLQYVTVTDMFYNLVL